MSTPGSHEYNLFVGIMSKTDNYHVTDLAAFLREGFNKRKLFLRNINQKQSTIDKQINTIKCFINAQI